MSVQSDNRLIDALAECLRFYGSDSDGAQVVYGCGWRGEGWYVFSGEYPDGGAHFVRAEEYGALEVALAIVDAEREEARAQLAIAALLSSGLRVSKALAAHEVAS